MLLKSIMDVVRGQGTVELVKSELGNGIVKMVTAGMSGALANGLLILMNYN
jgi:hypothetical protein